MPDNVSLTAEQWRSWVAALEEARDPNSRLRELLNSPSIFERPVTRALPTYDSGRDAIVWRSTHGFQVLQTRDVVPMSDVESVAAWDGHEPEDL